MTNGDKIRQMSNEELAEMLSGNCTYCAFRGGECIEGCEVGTLAYLDMEVEE